MGVLLARSTSKREGATGMIKPSRNRPLQPQAGKLASVSSNSSNGSDRRESSIRIAQNARNDLERSISMRIASRLKERIPALAIQAPSTAKLTSGLRQTLRSASGTLQKLNHPKVVAPSSEKQVVQEVLDHRRLARKKPKSRY